MFNSICTYSFAVRPANRLTTSLIGILVLRAVLLITFFTMASNPLFAVLVDTVSVGSLNNPNDPESNFGAVDYAYRIGTYEVTNAQYTEFLNSVAATDTHGLFNSNMTTRLRGGIERDGNAGEYTYRVKDNFENKPVIWVNLWDAARFVNWLHNDQPLGNQTAATTESGAYDLSGLDPNVDSIEREEDAFWFLPSADEWYKAAYYQPPELGGDVDGYWAYATATNDFPTCAQADETTGDIVNPGSNVVNYMRCANWNGTGPLPSPGNITTVGSAGEMSQSFFGTYDQSGNVAEWIEPPYTTDDFAVLGGLLFSGTSSLEASNAKFVIPSTNEANAGGFRVARIAKPMVAGDFNEDKVLDAEDIDMLSEQIFAQANDPFFDLNGDLLVNEDELQFWVKTIRVTWFGDANIDGEFNSSDFTQVFQAGKYELGTSAMWSEGDWNADGLFDSTDLIAAFQDGGYEIGPLQVANVPEPKSTTLLLVALLCVRQLFKQRSRRVN